MKTSVIPDQSTAFFHADEIVRYLGLTPGMKVADFGSGSGFLAVVLARAVGSEGHVYAVDILETAVESARSRARFFSLPQMTAVRGDAARVGGSGISDASLDMVVCSNLFFQVQDREREAVFQEVKRALKQKGALAIMEWKEDAPFGPPKDARVTRSQLIELGKASGFSLQKEFTAGSHHFGLIFSS